MKKFASIILIAVIGVSLILGAVGCSGSSGGKNFEVADKNFGNYNESNLVEGMSAFDLVTEAYTNFVQETDYVREEYFTFAAKKGTLASRNTHLIRKMQGDKIYSQEIICGTGMDGGTCAKKYYFDGENAYEIYNTNKKNVSYDQETGEFSIKSWGEFTEFDGDVERENWLIKDKITTYDISKKEYMSPTNHTDKVYKVGNTYYCTLAIDCSIERMTTVQREAMQEFLDMLSAKEEGFTIEDTTIDFAIEDVDGKIRIKIWRRNEKYVGKHSTGLKVG
ncbi:MAG: hypothetical protein K2K24_02205, partial [Clostridia bacterium]|nr:hypothetical protein [Clostridia bacterium]